MSTGHSPQICQHSWLALAQAESARHTHSRELASPNRALFQLLQIGSAARTGAGWCRSATIEADLTSGPCARCLLVLAMPAMPAVKQQGSMAATKHRAEKSARITYLLFPSQASARKQLSAGSYHISDLLSYNRRAFRDFSSCCFVKHYCQVGTQCSRTVVV